MNYQQMDVLHAILQSPYSSQRELSAACGHSLGAVNSALKRLRAEEYLDSELLPTEKALARVRTPRNAIILAAGFGMRMVPINTVVPKGLLEVYGEPLIERLIRQLQQAGVENICVVVGFMKEQFEYLIDSYGVQLICNTHYAEKNNLHSLAMALSYLSDAYIVPSDIWCRENPFRSRELYSWYLLTDLPNPASPVHVGRNRTLCRVSPGKTGNTMLGIAFLTQEDGLRLQQSVRQMCTRRQYDGAFWEDALTDIPLCARVVSSSDALEINTFEQLRDLDRHSAQLQSAAIDVICRTLHTDNRQISHISVLKKGMTNRSFLFRCRDRQYIMRIPGEGTGQLINRAQEAAVYHTISGRNICDDILFIDPATGYKITAFWSGARVCDPKDPRDTALCMTRLRQFHESNLQVSHTFDLFEQIEFYQSLWNGQSSVFRDYEATKAQVLSLRTFIEAQPKKLCLTHIDAVPDNFLFIPDSSGQEQIRLIDWEYAGMQDPHVDIAMFCIYAMYDRQQVDALIDQYFPEGCDPLVRTKLYCYISVCGLLWSNWCEYKRQLGVEFGEYSLRQYRFAKEYYRIASRRIREGETPCIK